MGSHKKANPRGSPTGKKGRGDLYRIKYLGRRRRFLKQRKKALSPSVIKTEYERKEIELTELEIQIFTTLFYHKHFDRNPMSWTMFKEHLDLLGYKNIQEDVMIDELQLKMKHLMKIIPFHCIHLVLENKFEIDELIKGIRAEEKNR